MSRNTLWKSLLTDLAAAVRLGHPAALEAALDALARHPEIADNRPLSARWYGDFLRPAGRILADSRFPMDELRVLRDSPLAGMRALGGAALALRYLKGDAAPRDLLPAAKDPRPDVRRLMGQTLAEGGAAAPERLLALGRAWLSGDSPRLRHTALLALRGAASSRGEAVFPLLEALPPAPDAESGEALASLLTALARNGHSEAVLGFVERRALAEPPDLWLAGRVLSGKWAAARAARLTALLDVLQARHGESRYISNLRRALRRHGG